VDVGSPHTSLQRQHNLEEGESKRDREKNIEGERERERWGEKYGGRERDRKKSVLVLGLPAHIGTLEHFFVLYGG
jgi:hypothetical protein